MHFSSVLLRSVYSLRRFVDLAASLEKDRVREELNHVRFLLPGGPVSPEAATCVSCRPSRVLRSLL